MYVGTLNKNYYHPGHFFLPKTLLGDFNTTNQQGITAAQQAISYWQNEYNNDPTPNALQQLNYWKAQLQTLLKAQQMGPNYIATHPNSFTNWFNQFFNTFNQQLQTPGGILPVNPNDLIPDTSFFSADFAGLPVWAWLGILAAGIYLFYDNTKKRK